MKRHDSLPYSFYTLLFVVFLFAKNLATAQPITGVWNGRIDSRKVELKVVQKGDSLTGTAYYFQSPQHYTQYSIRGYFDPQDNSVVWWDDVLLEDRGSGLLHNTSDALLSTADFNCPGSGRMYLNGQSKKREAVEVSGSVALTKVETPTFPDIWDYVIDNYTQGTNDPYVIDSIALVAFSPVPKKEIVVPVKKEVSAPVLKKEPVRRQPPVVTAPTTNEEKFKTREKKFISEIPVSGDSLELRFYDNAEIDGDSISVFLNGQMLFEHVRLSEKAYTIKLPTTAFEDTAELVMVAENLGTIPPNTSLMVALCGSQRYEARLASSEKSSAYIRLKKEGNIQK